MNEWTFKKLRTVFHWKQEYFGMLFGMGKQSVSRFETGERRETLQHKEMLSMMAFIDEKGLVNEYLQRRFNVSVSRRYYKNGTPMADLKYIENNRTPLDDYVKSGEETD